MGVPKAALEAERKADEAIAKAQTIVDGANDDTPTEVIEVPSSEEANGQPSVEVQIPAKPAPAPVVNATVEGLQDELKRSEQLRKTVEGRMRSQLKPAMEEIRVLKSQNADLESQVSDLKLQLAKPGEARHLSEEERNELGEDVVDVQTRLVKGLIEETFEQTGLTKDRMDSLFELNKAAKSSQETEALPSDFWPLVEQLSPGSRDTNKNDPRWLDFLDLYDQATGAQNRERATSAMTDNDPSALADLFDEFNSLNGIDSKPGSVVAESVTVRPENGGQEQIVAPAGASEDEKWSEAEVASFYEDVARGRFKGRETEAEEIDSQIMDAAAKGLITP